MRISGWWLSTWLGVGLAACSSNSQPGSQTNSPLAGTHWWLVRVGETEAPESEPEHRAHLVFDAAASHVSGSGGCNRLSGSYEQSGDTLRFGAIASTRMACPEMVVEAALFEALGRVALFEIRGRVLELQDSGGARLVSFEADLAP